MNWRKACQLLLVLAAALSVSGAAMAGGYYHGGGGGWGGGYHGGGYYHGGYCCGTSVGVYFGPGFVGGYPYGYPYPPYYYPGYYPDSYAYGPMSVSDPSSPTQYMEQGQAAPAGGAAPQSNYWCHCGKPEGYYPYVKACPAGWQKVPAQPPGS